MATTCVKCGGHIREGNAIVVIEEVVNSILFKSSESHHPGCVERPERLHHDGFRKWAVHAIRGVQQTANVQVH